jgi:NitT/TauT family transport system substrate-binding protein
LTIVRFGFVPNPFAVAYYAAVSRGCFARLGLRIEETRFRNGSAVADALAAGQIDCGVGGHLQTLEAAHAGHDQLLIAPLGYEEPPDHLCIALVSRLDNVTSGKDLEGRTVAFSARGAMSDLQLRIFMDASRADFHRLRIVLMPFSRMSDALRNREVDAASIVEPFASAIVASGTGRLIERGSLSARQPLGKRALIAGVATSRDWLAGHPATAASVAQAVREGIAILRRDQDTARRMISEYTGVPSAITSHMQLPAFYPDLDPRDLQWVFDLATALGVVDRGAHAENLIARVE